MLQWTLNSSWLIALSLTRYFTNRKLSLTQPHSHDFVEIIGLIGTNPMNCREFEAEIEWCLGEEQEKHIINVPTVVSMAKGLLHGPIEIRKSISPLFFLRSC